MPDCDLLLEDVPELSIEALSQLLDVLYALIDALESRSHVLLRQRKTHCPLQDDLINPNSEVFDFDDPLTPF
jgi:hypothetical protein